MDSAEQRRARAEIRRGSFPGEIVRLGQRKPALYEGKTLIERLALQTELVARQRALAGHPPHGLRRSEWPGEIFDIEERNRRARR